MACRFCKDFMEVQRAQDILRRAREKGILVCLYTSAYSENFAAGFVEAVSEKYVILRSFSNHGRYDGWLLRQLENLPRIEFGGRYEESLLFLMKARETKHPQGVIPSFEADASLLIELFLAAQKHDFVVSIDTGSQSNIVGFVNTVEATTVTITKVDNNGEVDGESVVELDAIEKVNADDEDCQDLKLMARWHELDPPNW